MLTLRNDFEIEKFTNELLRQKETLLLDQLSELIENNLLVIKTRNPVLTVDPYGKKVKIDEYITLEVPQQDVINKLKNENELLKAKLAEIKEVLEERE